MEFFLESQKKNPCFRQPLLMLECRVDALQKRQHQTCAVFHMESTFKIRQALKTKVLGTLKDQVAHRVRI